MQKVTVLLIEDNQELLENTAELLALNGYVVFGTNNGEQGIIIAKEKHPEIILCDICMPGMDGYEVFYNLKKDNETKDIPFVFLTGKCQVKEIAEGIACGANAYLLKPFNTEDLIKTVRLELYRHHKRKKAENSDITNSNSSKAILPMPSRPDSLSDLENHFTI